VAGLVANWGNQEEARDHRRSRDSCQRASGLREGDELTVPQLEHE
jgi:hypothetical protein